MKPHRPIAQKPSEGESFEAVLSRRLARRSFLKGSLSAVPAVVLAPALLGQKAQAATPINFFFNRRRSALPTASPYPKAIARRFCCAGATRCLPIRRLRQKQGEHDLGA
jgi:hypothetical protein